MTALELLEDWIDKHLKLVGYEHKEIFDKIQELKKMEKDQIIEAWEIGDNNYPHGGCYSSGEDYYNSTYPSRITE